MATRASSMRWGRLLLAVVVVTGLVAVILSLVVAVYGAILGAQAQGAPDQAQLQRFADRVGAWLGTVLAVVLTAGAARWVARGM